MRAGGTSTSDKVVDGGVVGGSSTGGGGLVRDKRTHENIPRTVSESTKGGQVGGMHAAGAPISDRGVDGAGVVGGGSIRGGGSSRANLYSVPRTQSFEHAVRTSYYDVFARITRYFGRVPNLPRCIGYSRSRISCHQKGRHNLRNLVCLICDLSGSREFSV